MSRVQLALNVGDLDAAIDHYTRMFGVGPAKVRDGYANFVVADPPLKLVLIAGSQPHSKLISSNFEASLALFREIEDLLTSSTFNGGYLRGCDGCLSDSARERGDGRQHASQVLRVK